MKFNFATIICVALLAIIIVSSKANAVGSRQSNGKGNFALDMSFEMSETKIKMLSTTGSVTPSFMNTNYDIYVKRDVSMFTGSYGVLDQLDVFGGIGFSLEDFRGDRKSNPALSYKQYGANSIYEVGIKGTALKLYQDKIYVAYLVKYNYTKSGSQYKGPTLPEKSEAVWKNYNVDLEVGYNIEEYKLTPYVGVSYFNIEGEQNLDNYAGFANYDSIYDSEDSLGYFVGANYEVIPSVSLNVEVNLGATESAKAGIQLKF